MSSWGLSSQGLYAPQTQEVIDVLVGDLQVAFGAQFGASTLSPEGQFTAIFGSALADLYATNEATYNAAIPSNASGPALDDCLSAFGGERIPATESVINGVVITGTPGTAVPAGFQVAVASNTSLIFQIAAATTIGGGGTVTASFVAVNTGPVAAPAGQLTSIVNPVAGIASVTNPTDAVVGRAVETDAAFRNRAATERNRPGTGTPDGLVAAILAVANVSACVPVWNDNDVTSPNGVPPHAFELVVTGGVDADVANAIWLAHGAGITTYGNTTVTVFDADGDSHAVSFSRIVVVQVYVGLVLTTNTDPTSGPVYPPNGDSQVQQAVAGIVFNSGQTVYPLAILAAAASIQGVETAVVTLSISASPSPPVATAPLAFASDHQAVIQAANVTVTP